jgi:hypothetical protein
MLNRDILLDVLYRKSSTGELERQALSITLLQSRRFTLSPEEINLWLSIFQSDSIVNIESKTRSTERDLIRLNFESPLIHRLLGRMNVFGLILTLRRMGATNPNKVKQLVEVIERLARSSTRGDKQLSKMISKWLVKLKTRETILDIKWLMKAFHILSTVVILPLDFLFLPPFPVPNPGAFRGQTACLC